jgi:hypothetical protein
MIQQSSPVMRSRHKGIDDTHSEVGEKEIRKGATWFKILLGSVILTKSHHKKDLMMVTRLLVGAEHLEAL